MLIKYIDPKYLCRVNSSRVDFSRSISSFPGLSSSYHPLTSPEFQRKSVKWDKLELCIEDDTVRDSVGQV